MPYRISEGTKAKLEQLMADRPGTSGGGYGGGGPRFAAYVMNSEEPAVVVWQGEWVPVSTAPVILLDANDEDLETDRVYLALQFGLSGDSWVFVTYTPEPVILPEPGCGTDAGIVAGIDWAVGKRAAVISILRSATGGPW